MGQQRYPKATRLTITADGGGSNGARVRLWKLELQQLADELGLAITVCHLPPGTSKWNKIEHRLFSFITQNWRGKPLISHQVIVQLIAATTTKTGLKVRCELDPNSYPTGTKVADAELAGADRCRVGRRPGRAPRESGSCDTRCQARREHAGRSGSSRCRRPPRRPGERLPGCGPGFAGVDANHLTSLISGEVSTTVSGDLSTTIESHRALQQARTTGLDVSPIAIAR